MATVSLFVSDPMIIFWSVIELLRGLVPIVLVGIGLVALAAGVTQVRQEKDLKDEEILEE